jgi:glyoxylase-like metal-dependent hydrolase (beta-lactamase superfamily II)
MTGPDFTIHEIEGYLGTLFIAEYTDKLLVLDGGCRSDVPRIIRVVETMEGKSMKDITLLIASHPHPDHVGGVLALKKQYHLPLAVPPGINRWYAGVCGSLQQLVDSLMGYWVAIKSRKKGIENIFYNKKIQADYSLVEGKTLPYFNDWTVIEAPGHTTHDIVLYNRDKKILYTGDVIIKIKGRFMLPFPVSFPSLMKQSLSRLKTLDVACLLMPHGGIISVSDFHAVLEKLLRRLERGLSTFWKGLIRFQQFSPEVRRRKKSDF